MVKVTVLCRNERQEWVLRKFEVASFDEAVRRVHATTEWSWDHPMYILEYDEQATVYMYDGDHGEYEGYHAVTEEVG